MIVADLIQINLVRELFAFLVVAKTAELRRKKKAEQAKKEGKQQEPKTENKKTK